MLEHRILVALALDEPCLSLDQIAAACAVDREWVRLRLREGLLGNYAGDETGWRFPSALLRRARRMAALERDFDAAPELAALVADLHEEIERLRRRLRRAGLE